MNIWRPFQIGVALLVLVIAGSVTYGVLTAGPTGTPEEAATLLRANRARLDNIIRLLRSEPTLIDTGVDPSEPIEERGGVVIGTPTAAHTRRAYDEIAATMRAMQLRDLVATRDGDGLRSVEFNIYGDGYFRTATRVGALWLAPSRSKPSAEPGCRPSGIDRWLICPGNAGDYAQQTGAYSD